MADVAFAAAQTDFAVGLLREAAAISNASAILSPISIALALSLAYAGAGVDTRREFERAFARGANTGDTLDAAFHRTFSQLTENKYCVALELVNRVYTAHDLHVKAAYRELLAANFGAAFQQVDFERQPEEAVAEINEFVANATHQKIRDLLSPDDVDYDTRMMLVNAVYFKGEWDELFSEERTTDETFFVDENNERQVKMMKQEINGVKYTDTDHVQVLELPYADKAAKFTVFLPKKKCGLSAWLQKVDGAELLDLMDRMHYTKVDVGRAAAVQDEAEFKLKEMLEKLGFSEGFNEKTANFNGISVERLYISEGFHKAFIEVNEKGSEAAAATALIMARVSSAIQYSEEPARFRADRPFAFLISRERIPLFFGRFMGPSL
ncbi:SERPIN domain-containing protein [Aphelenchoides fujianensis]|nr:SERPIN domain-containing protein [Aphelenchoides fujianensis]